MDSLHAIDPHYSVEIAQIESSLKWLLGKALDGKLRVDCVMGNHGGAVDNLGPLLSQLLLPDSTRSNPFGRHNSTHPRPLNFFATDNFGKPTHNLKGALTKALASGVVYKYACCEIFLNIDFLSPSQTPNAAHSSFNFNFLLKTMAHTLGPEFVEIGREYGLSSSTLALDNPFNMHNHMQLIDGMIQIRVKSLIQGHPELRFGPDIIERDMDLLSTLRSILDCENENLDHTLTPNNIEGQLTYVINQICSRVEEFVKNSKGTSFDSSNFVIDTKTPLFKEASDIMADLRDGTTLCGLLFFFYPDEFPIQRTYFPLQDRQATMSGSNQSHRIRTLQHVKNNWDLVESFIASHPELYAPPDGLKFGLAETEAEWNLHVTYRFHSFFPLASQDLLQFREDLYTNVIAFLTEMVKRLLGLSLREMGEELETHGAETGDERVTVQPFAAEPQKPFVVYDSDPDALQLSQGNSHFHTFDNGFATVDHNNSSRPPPYDGFFLKQSNQAAIHNSFPQDCEFDRGGDAIANLRVKLEARKRGIQSLKRRKIVEARRRKLEVGRELYQKLLLGAHPNTPAPPSVTNNTNFMQAFNGSSLSSSLSPTSSQTPSSHSYEPNNGTSHAHHAPPFCCSTTTLREALSTHDNTTAKYPPAWQQQQHHQPLQHNSMFGKRGPPLPYVGGAAVGFEGDKHHFSFTLPLAANKYYHGGGDCLRNSASPPGIKPVAHRPIPPYNATPGLSAQYYSVSGLPIASSSPQPPAPIYDEIVDNLAGQMAGHHLRMYPQHHSSPSPRNELGLGSQSASPTRRPLSLIEARDNLPPNMAISPCSFINSRNRSSTAASSLSVVGPLAESNELAEEECWEEAIPHLSTIKEFDNHFEGVSKGQRNMSQSKSLLSLANENSLAAQRFRSSQLNISSQRRDSHHNPSTDSPAKLAASSQFLAFTVPVSEISSNSIQDPIDANVSEFKDFIKFDSVPIDPETEECIIKKKEKLISSVVKRREQQEALRAKKEEKAAKKREEMRLKQMEMERKKEAERERKQAILAQYLEKKMSTENPSCCPIKPQHAAHPLHETHLSSGGSNTSTPLHHHKGSTAPKSSQSSNTIPTSNVPPLPGKYNTNPLLVQQPLTGTAVDNSFGNELSSTIDHHPSQGRSSISPLPSSKASQNKAPLQTYSRTQSFTQRRPLPPAPTHFTSSQTTRDRGRLVLTKPRSGLPNGLGLPSKIPTVSTGSGKDALGIAATYSKSKLSQLFLLKSSSNNNAGRSPTANPLPPSPSCSQALVASVSNAKFIRPLSSAKSQYSLRDIVENEAYEHRMPNDRYAPGLGLIAKTTFNAPKTTSTTSLINALTTHHPSSEVSTVPGAKLYMKPTERSNRTLIIQALNYAVLAGPANAEMRAKVLEAMAKSENKHFLILFRDRGMQYRAVYQYDVDREDLHKIHGTGPRLVTEQCIQFYYKYNSGSKSFICIPSKHVSATIDAFIIKELWWQTKKQFHASGAALSTALRR